MLEMININLEEGTAVFALTRLEMRMKQWLEKRGKKCVTLAFTLTLFHPALHVFWLFLITSLHSGHQDF